MGVFTEQGGDAGIEGAGDGKGEAVALRASQIRIKEVFEALCAGKVDTEGVPKRRRGTRNVGPHAADTEEEQGRSSGIGMALTRVWETENEDFRPEFEGESRADWIQDAIQLLLRVGIRHLIVDARCV
jgi:hypothetical protein